MTAARRSLYALLAVALPMVWCAALPVLAAGEGRPQVQLPEKAFSFGSVPAGQKVAHDFPIRNVGSMNLEIIGTSPSCGCTVASLSSSVIKPGEAATMRVEFDTSGFSGDKVKTVEIASNDAANARASVVLKGTIVAGASVEPPILEFGRLSSQVISARLEKRFTVRLPSHVAGDISKVTSSSPYIEAREASRSAKEAVFVVALKDNVPKGLFRDRVLIEFSGGKLEPINVPIVATVVSDIVLKPSTISFGVVSGETELERRVQFEYRSSEPLTIKYVTSSNSAVSAYYQPGSGRGMNGTIVVKLNPQKVTGDLKATVEIATNHPTQPKTFLNVYATLPPS